MPHLFLAPQAFRSHFPVPAVWSQNVLPTRQVCARACAGASRGLVVVGELSDPADVVSAAHVAASLGWPVAADILSGLRLGGSSSSRSGGEAGSSTGLDGRLSVVHHMDQLLLDKRWVRACVLALQHAGALSAFSLQTYDA